VDKINIILSIENGLMVVVSDSAKGRWVGLARTEFAGMNDVDCPAARLSWQQQAAAHETLSFAPVERLLE
jgi:hypothetical protein